VKILSFVGTRCWLIKETTGHEQLKRQAVDRIFVHSEKCVI